MQGLNLFVSLLHLMTWNIKALYHSKKAFHDVTTLLAPMSHFQPPLKQTKLMHINDSIWQM